MCRPFRRLIIGRPFVSLAWLLSFGCILFLIDNYIFNIQLIPGIFRNERLLVVQGLASNRISSDNYQLLNERGHRCLVECPAGQISYHVKSGEGRDVSPLICFNGKYIIGRDGQNGMRGINLVVVDNVTLDVVNVKAFDVYKSTSAMQKYLIEGVRNGYIVIVASMDDVSSNMGDDGKMLLQGYGSMLITKLGFRDSFVMIGQKGLEEGRAIEKLLSREDGQKFPEPVEIVGCLKVPLGLLRPQIFDVDDTIISAETDLGKDLPNCGVKEPCGNDSFSVQLFTGIRNTHMAKMCIDGKNVFTEGLNDAGPGLNMAVVEPLKREVVRVGHFDMQAKDRSLVEAFLEMLGEKHIVIIVSFDDASRKLDSASQQLIRALGSSYSNSLGFRDAWVLVGQQGIDGYSEIEALSPCPEGHWPQPINKRMCVPTLLKGRRTPLPRPSNAKSN